MLREYIPEAAHSFRMSGEKPWWQTCGTREFGDRIQGMEIDAMEVLMSEIRGAIAVTQGQVQGPKAEDKEWARRAKAAIGFMSEKRRLLATRLTQLNREKRSQKELDHAERDQMRGGRIAEARGAMARGDLAAAVTCILDILEGR